MVSRNVLRRWLVVTILLWGGVGCASHGGKVERRSAIVISAAGEVAEKFGLVDIRKFIPDVAVDLRYGTPYNVAHQPLYPSNMPCLLKRETAKKLAKAQDLLRTQGYAIRIWDAWRPTEIQLTLMEKGGDTGMFLDPKVAWSRHCSGTAIDVTLVDKYGVEQRMPTHHDEMSDKSNYFYTGGDPIVSKGLQTLQVAMTKSGFQMIDLEWWHFDDAEFFPTTQAVVSAKDIGLVLPVVH
jgi:zinc D-Ala-D-Ala dipeptidase